MLASNKPTNATFAHPTQEVLVDILLRSSRSSRSRSVYRTTKLTIYNGACRVHVGQINWKMQDGNKERSWPFYRCFNTIGPSLLKYRQAEKSASMRQAYMNHRKWPATGRQSTTGAKQKRICGQVSTALSSVELQGLKKCTSSTRGHPEQMRVPSFSCMGKQFVRPIPLCITAQHCPC